MWRLDRKSVFISLVKQASIILQYYCLSSDNFSSKRRIILYLEVFRESRKTEFLPLLFEACGKLSIEDKDLREVHPE